MKKWRRMRNLKLAAVFLSVVMCGSLAIVNDSFARPQVTANSSVITWEACPDFGFPSGELECGQLAVPLDYTKPQGKRITIAVSRLKARKPQLRQGVMLLNPGGPGGQGLDMPLWMAELMPQSVLDRYDLIGFDPRGLGYSTPVSCGLTEEETSEIAPPLMQPGGFDATAMFVKTVADRCAATSGDYLAYITTANTARDMERIRYALGEQKISYFGYSYGSYLGAVYAALYPNNTDKFVLDSAANARADWRELFRSWGKADYTRFPDFAKFLIDNEAEYNMGSTQQEVRNTYFQLLRQVEEHPVSLPDGMVIDGPWFRVYTFAGLYSDNYFADTAEVWRLIRENQATAKLQALVASLRPRPGTSFPEVPIDNGGALTNAVLCDDVAWSRRTMQYRLELTADSLLYPMFGELGSNIWPCAFWHYAPKEPPVAITANGLARKILIVQNRRDPATPYANGQEMRRALGNRARLLTVEQGGHGASYGENNECAKETVTNYFVDGTFPEKDETCVAETNLSMAADDRAVKAMKELRRRMW